MECEAIILQAVALHFGGQEKRRKWIHEPNEDGKIWEVNNSSGVIFTTWIHHHILHAANREAAMTHSAENPPVWNQPPCMFP